jgi:hypothetical protein
LYQRALHRWLPLDHPGLHRDSTVDAPVLRRSSTPDLPPLVGRSPIGLR